MAHDAPLPPPTRAPWHGVTWPAPDPIPARTIPGHDRPDPLPRRYTAPDGTVYRHAAHVTTAALADLRRWARRVSDAANVGDGGTMMAVCRGYDGTPWECHTVYIVGGIPVAAVNTYDGPPCGPDDMRGVVVESHPRTTTAPDTSDVIETAAWDVVTACAMASGAWG